MMRAADGFIIHAVCERFDPDEVKVAAVQAVLDAAGFNATATCWPVFGGIWPRPCEGAEAEAATEWLQNLTDTMQRGDSNAEVEHVEAAIKQRAAEVA